MATIPRKTTAKKVDSTQERTSRYLDPKFTEQLLRHVSLAKKKAIDDNRESDGSERT